jgi:hypothetical protein
MLPWHADPGIGKFQNDRRLGKGDRADLLAWIDQGCPKGDDKDLPPPRKFADTWRIGKPDMVFTMSNPAKVPAKAPWGIEYRYFQVPTNLTEDVWVQAAEARPVNRAAVHHIIVYIFDPATKRQRTPDGIGEGFLVAHAPGDVPGNDELKSFFNKGLMANCGKLRFAISPSFLRAFPGMACGFCLAQGSLATAAPVRNWPDVFKRHSPS